MRSVSDIEPSLIKAVTDKMSAAGASELIQSAFLRAISVVQSGQDGLIPESTISPAPTLPDIEQLDDYSKAGAEAIESTVVIKLNGGLGTSMGLARAKSLLPVKDGRSFLEIIAKQVAHLRERYHTDVPLIFMNSFRTEQDTKSILDGIAQVESGQAGMPFSFLQNKVPKLDAATYEPVTHPKDPELEWCPPGHGDLYVALNQTQLLDRLLAKGYRYAFVSNADNLGASLDINLLGYFAALGAPFLMEVADRTEADKKGGHLATAIEDGHLLLREVAQCPDGDIDQFQNVNKHRYFNTNSLWLSLPALADVINKFEGVLPLPIIVNRKTVDPTDSTSTEVVQLESAMGAAIEIFDGASAVRVGRDRFLPVKQTSDLLLLMSDLFEMQDSGTLHRATSGKLPAIELDARYFKHIDDFLERFDEIPSLRDCTQLSIAGDVRFGANVRIVGAVAIAAPDGTIMEIPADSTITDNR